MSKIDSAKLQIVREGLSQVSPLLDELIQASEAAQPFDPKAIPNRSISGDKITGGKITKFESVGIKDDSSRLVVLVNDDGLLTDKIDVETLVGDTNVEGNLHVQGQVFAEKLHVNEVTADTRHERSSSLEFHADHEGGVFAKGLKWIGTGHTRQLILKANPDRLWSTESFDLHGDSAYYVDGSVVLTKTKLGESVRESRLTKTGTLQNLQTSGNLTVDEFIFWDSGTMRLGVGTDQPNALLSIKGMDAEYIVEPDSASVKAGTWTSTALDIITDDTARISISSIGDVTVHKKLVINDKLSIGIKNPGSDVDLTVAGAVRLQDRKFEVADSTPTNGTYKVGDTVWNANPQPGGYMGWVCVREGTPGEWKTFGQISK